MATEKQIGWWMDRETCIGCDRHMDELEHVNYIDMRPNTSRRKESHAHNIIVMICEVCSNLYCAPDSYIPGRMEVRLRAWRENCKCHTFFETQSNTPIAMMRSRS